MIFLFFFFFSWKKTLFLRTSNSIDGDIAEMTCICINSNLLKVIIKKVVNWPYLTFRSPNIFFKNSTLTWTVKITHLRYWQRSQLELVIWKFREKEIPKNSYREKRRFAVCCFKITKIDNIFTTWFFLPIRVTTPLNLCSTEKLEVRGQKAI